MSPSYPRSPRAYPGSVLGRSRRLPWHANSWLLFAGFAAIFVLVLLPFFLLGGTIAYYSLADRIYPGVHTIWFSAGDLTRAEFAQKIDTEWNHQARLVLTDGTRSWPAVPADLGLW
ncbi:MAG: hypothetical protein IH586_11830, partial [Anaerolineaceae bacterium]|nr:hypothetical protein [Anaerolineaceae bacterium]